MSKELTDDEAQDIMINSNSYYIYPWDKWLNGNWHLLVEGVDYHIPTVRFRNQTYKRQMKWGTITTRIIDGNSILIKRKP